MRGQLLGNRPRSWRAVILVLALFVAIGSWHWRHSDAEDLASSFVGSRLLIQHLPQHLFHYDPVSFAEIGEDDTWSIVAKQGGFNGYLHPYVQTPLWAYLLEPLCRHLQFPLFNTLFAFLSMVIFALTIFLVARRWAPALNHPRAIAAVCALLLFSQPFRYAMYLNQTHMLLVFLSVAALMLAEDNRPVWAGLLLAFAAAVKLTPVLLVVYWLLNRRWMAAVSTAAWSAVLWVCTVVAVGHTLADTYLLNLHRISHVLLVSQNNQSFAAWWMARFYPSDAVFDIDIYPLPEALRLLSSALMLGFTAWGGWLDRQRLAVGDHTARAPLGAMIALVAATIFAPIAWTHYSVILFLPLMLLADTGVRTRARAVWAAIALVILMNYQPFATDIIHGLIGPLSLIRGQFYAGVLTLAALGAVALRQLRRQPVGLASSAEPVSQPATMAA